MISWEITAGYFQGTHTHTQKSINQLLRLFLDVLVFTYQYKHIENRRWKKYVVSSLYFLLSSLGLSAVRFFLALEMFVFFPNMLRGSPSYISTLDASQWQSVFSIFSSSLPHLPRHPSLHLLPLQSSDEASQVWSSDSDSVTASVIHLQHVTHHARKHKNTHGCTFLNNNIHTHYIIPLVDITQIGAGSINIFPYVMWSGTCTHRHIDRHLTQNMGFPNASTFTLCCYYTNLNDNTSKGLTFTWL